MNHNEWNTKGPSGPVSALRIEAPYRWSIGALIAVALAALLGPSLKVPSERAEPTVGDLSATSEARRSAEGEHSGLLLLDSEDELGSEGPIDAFVRGVTRESVPAAMPLEINESVRYWVGRFTTDQRPTFQLYLDRQGRYGPMIREDAIRRGLPSELAYLAMIESGFSVDAVSRVEAVGLWQFMGPTAQAFGLRIDEWVDERRDPIRATRAALEYLSQLHERYGSWYLAAAAYNAGPTRVDLALTEHFGRAFEVDRLRGAASTGSEGDIFWTIRHRLPFETRHHVPRLIAAALIAQDPASYGFRTLSASVPDRFDEVWVPQGTRLRDVAASLEVPLGRLHDLNPQLIQGITPPGQAYGLRVPAGRAADVVNALAAN
jgi:membrane-bound lytic murein transglycosylase D